jgi:hypothetical protein
MVRLAVAVKLDCDWEVAVIVTTPLLVVGTVAGAVYNPALVIDPELVPPTDQFTKVLPLTFKTVAVHCAVPSTVTLAPVPWVGVHTADMVGGVVVLAALPQELRIAGTAISAKKNKRRSQRTLSRPEWKFGSSTRNPPARTTLIFLRKIRSFSCGRLQVADLPRRLGDGGESPHPSDGANIGCLDPNERIRLPLKMLPTCR